MKKKANKKKKENDDTISGPTPAKVRKTDDNKKRSKNKSKVRCNAFLSIQLLTVKDLIGYNQWNSCIIKFLDVTFNENWK